VEDLIIFYAYRNKVNIFTPVIRKHIQKISRESFWLIAYALEGCNEADGKGDPQSWIRDGVNKDLKHLEGLKSDYPEVLLALSPLYMNEVLTSEVYLRKNIKIKKQILNNLYKMGEITKIETEDGHVFYGLPHSALAKAYWEHGKIYRKNLPEYEDFIYNYSALSMPNGIEAMVAAGKKIAKNLAVRLHKGNKTSDVILNEKSWEAIVIWTIYACNKSRITDSVIAAFVYKIKEFSNFDFTIHITHTLCGYSLDIGKAFLTLLILHDKQNFQIVTEYLESVERDYAEYCSRLSMEND